MTMPLVEALGRIEEITTQVKALSTRADASSAAAFDQALAAQTAQGASAVTATPATATGAGVTGEAIVAKAKEYLGVPYVLGGNDKTGIDCSGLVQQVLGEFGIDVPRRVSQQQSVGVEVPSLADAQPGDLIVTNNADHIVIYAGDGMIVHAPYEGRTVSFQKNYLSEGEIQTIRRVAPDASASAVAATASSVAGPASPVAGLGGPVLLGGSGALGGVDAQRLLAALSSGALGGVGGGVAGGGSSGLGMLSALGAFGVGASAGSAGTATGAGLGSGGIGSGGLTDLVLAAQVQALLRGRA
jgi:hypothetical protein